MAMTTSDGYEVVDSFHFKHPSLIICCGPTFAGKSETVLKIIQQNRDLIEPQINRLLFVYSELQPNLFSRIKLAFPTVEFIHGLEALQDNVEFDTRQNTLLIIDDLFYEVTKSKYVLDLAIKGCHHKSITL